MLNMELKVLYEDNHLIAVFKPARVLAQSDSTKDESLMDKTKKYLKEKYKKPGNVFLGLVHRLDRPVSGIVLFAKTSKGASRLSEQFRSHKIKKIYYAVVIGKPRNKKGTIKSYISKNELKKKAIISDEKNGQLAELYYEIISSNNSFSLLKVEPKTGRFHQIRAQLSSIECPILGDIKYGAPDPLIDNSICLCAASITFLLTTKEEIKTISISYPREWEKMTGLL